MEMIQFVNTKCQQICENGNDCVLKNLHPVGVQAVGLGLWKALNLHSIKKQVELKQKKQQKTS